MSTTCPLRVNEVLRLLLLLLVFLAIVIPSRLLRLPLVELIQDLLGDTVEQLLGVDAEELPSLVETVEDGALFVRALRDVCLLELLKELERQLILVAQRLLTDDSLHAGGVTTDGVFGVQLVGHIAVVLARVAFADGRLHQSGEGREDVDGRVDTLVVERTVDEDLTLGNVSSKIGNGVSNVCREKARQRSHNLKASSAERYIPSLGIVKMGI